MEHLPKSFKFDRKVLAEECIVGRELECSVLGNEHPIASLPGEVIPEADFYSFESKYSEESEAHFEIPAKIPEALTAKIQQLSIQVFKTLQCEGMGRVDFFLRNDDVLLVNEINTIPGFTSISLYPKLWVASGLPIEKLVEKLIHLAEERLERESTLSTS